MGAISHFTGGNAAVRAKLNQLVDAANALQQVTGDGMVAVSKTPSGYNLRLAVDRLLPRIPRPANRPLWARITGSTVVGATSNCQWLYSFAALELTQASASTYPAATNLTGGLAISDGALNAAEINNHNAYGSSVPYGNGIYPDQLDPDDDGTDEFAIEPVPVGQVVLLSPFSVSGDYGELMYLFSAINPVSGECDK